MYRIAGAVAALVLAVLLGWTIFGATETEPPVLPTNGVIDRGPQDDLPVDSDARQALHQRTTLQRWRGESGPSPAQPADPVVMGQEMPASAANRDPLQLVAGWLSARERQWQLLRDRGYVAGAISLPDDKLSVLQQPQGRDWRSLHNQEIVFGGGIVIFGFSLLLALFLAARGRVPLVEGYSGRSVLRFSAFERANHWVTAISFLVIALTGLVLLYGQHLLKPLVGASAYGDLALASAYVHMVFVLPFVLGVAIMVVLWIGQNGFSRLDLHWLKRGGGFLSNSPDKPPAKRFNTGQKLVFWGVVLGSLLLLASGLALMFPLFWLGVVGMQWAQLAHAGIGLCMIALIIGHIYIGTVGMEGAFEAMWSGRVDYNWAKEHHDLWLQEKEEGRGA